MDPLAMNQTHHLWLYFVLVAGIVAVPGMEMAYALSSTLVNGRRSGFAAVAGSVTGGLAHVAMSSLGIGLLLQYMPLAFNALLLAGALYVGWMGYSMCTSPGALQQVGHSERQTVRETFLRALMTCLLNPKAYVFMLAVFPQFIKPQYGSLVLQSIVLWLLGALAQIAIYGLVVLTALRFTGWLSQSEGHQKRVAQAVGLLMIATALWTLVTGWAM